MCLFNFIEQYYCIRLSSDRFSQLPTFIVSACEDEQAAKLVQEAFAKEPDLWFAQKGLGGDNAVGVAILASMR